MQSSLCLVLLIAVAVNAQTWSAWTPVTTPSCSATCGYCGVQVIATRTCSVLGKCSGAAQQYEECGKKMCPFPRKTCCPGYIKGQLAGGAGFECVPKDAVMKPKTKLT